LRQFRFRLGCELDFHEVSVTRKPDTERGEVWPTLPGRSVQLQLLAGLKSLAEQVLHLVEQAG
jgi:hypothetical protein